MFDRNKSFVFIPGKEGGWSVQFIKSTHELGDMYHAKTVELDDDVAGVFTDEARLGNLPFADGGLHDRIERPESSTYAGDGNGSYLGQ